MVQITKAWRRGRQAGGQRLSAGAADRPLGHAAAEPGAGLWLAAICRATSGLCLPYPRRARRRLSLLLVVKIASLNLVKADEHGCLHILRVAVEDCIVDGI